MIDLSLVRSNNKTHKGSLSSRTRPNSSSSNSVVISRETMCEDLSNHVQRSLQIEALSEPMIEEIRDRKYEAKYFSDNETFVFWNLDDYPIPPGADPLSIIRNIRSALHQLGIRWRSRYYPIQAYGDDYKISDLCRAAGIYEGENLNGIKLPSDVISTAISRQRKPTNFVLVPKPSPQSQLHRVLHCLKSRNYAIIVLEPPDNTAQNSLDSLVDSTKVLGGGKLKSTRPQSFAYVKSREEDAFRWKLNYKPIGIMFENDEDAWARDWY